MKDLFPFGDSLNSGALRATRGQLLQQIQAFKSVQPAARNSFSPSCILSANFFKLGREWSWHGVEPFKRNHCCGYRSHIAFEGRALYKNVSKMIQRSAIALEEGWGEVQVRAIRSTRATAFPVLRQHFEHRGRTAEVNRQAHSHSGGCKRLYARGNHYGRIYENIHDVQHVHAESATLILRGAVHALQERFRRILDRYCANLSPQKCVLLPCI